jgi:homoserine dehydrogenase
LTRDAQGVISDPAIDIVIELIGGVGIARELVLKTLQIGKPVVTANKKLLAEHGDKLFPLAEQKGVDLCFEASVGGGIPIIRALREGLIANHILDIYAILNGTCNYVLTRMEQVNLPFETVLREAQAAGYAETEPSLDIDGHDTAHKAAILASLAYGFPFPISAVHVEGIRGLAQEDIRFAAELGYRIKLLAIIRRQNGAVGVRVHPTLVPHNHLLAAVSGVYNAILVRGDIVGDTLYYGRGAGRLPTASAVISDVADLAISLAAGHQRRLPSFLRAGAPPPLAVISDSRTRYYLRLTLLDQPGVLAKVAAVLGAHQISIASMMQKEEQAGGHVPCIFITHAATERNFRAALEEINRLEVSGAHPVSLRIEDGNGHGPG